MQRNKKTECVFVAAPSYFKQCVIKASMPEYDRLLLNEEDDESDKKKGKYSAIEDKLYKKCQETNLVPVGDGFVTHCKHFKYLSLWHSLCEMILM